MKATPITPGRAYRVTHAGRSYTVLAAHACDAIVIVLGGLDA